MQQIVRRHPLTPSIAEHNPEAVRTMRRRSSLSV